MFAHGRKSSVTLHSGRGLRSLRQPCATQDAIETARAQELFGIESDYSLDSMIESAARQLGLDSPSAFIRYTVDRKCLAGKTAFRGEERLTTSIERVHTIVPAYASAAGAVRLFGPF